MNAFGVVGTGLALVLAVLLWRTDHALQQSRRDAAVQVAEAQAAARRIETQAADGLREARQQAVEARNATDSEVQKVVDDLRVGNRRLRYQCTENAATARLSGAASAERGNDGATQGGLSAADAEAFVRVAGDADAVVAQLTECQATVTQYYQLYGPAR